jgi:hypothetical protein
MRAALTAHSCRDGLIDAQFPDVFLMGGQHGNRGRAPIAMVLENSTYARNVRDGGNDAWVDPRRDGSNGPTPDLRHGAGRSEVYRSRRYAEDGRLSEDQGCRHRLGTKGSRDLFLLSQLTGTTTEARCGTPWGRRYRPFLRKSTHIQNCRGCICG